MEAFWKRRYNDLREGGWKSALALIKYAIATKNWIPGIILAVPFVLIMRVIRPLVWIRFGNMSIGRIGHGTYDVEYYLAEKEIGMHDGKHDYFFFGREPANEQFAKMCKRHLVIRSVFQYIWRANDLIPGGEKHVVPMAIRTNDYRDTLGLFNKTKSHLPFTAEENERGKQFLKQIGLDPQDRFVCLIVRDSTYLTHHYKDHNNKTSYHDYRDADIETFEEAALSLAEKGYWVFRMGKKVHKPLKVSHPRVLDYANTDHRNDFLDIWLMANCFFCISTSTGLDSVCMIYRRPVVYVNLDIFNQMVLHQKSIVVPKHYYWKESRRRLTFKECLEHSYTKTEEYKKAGIEIENLKKEEITQAVLEFEARLNNTWVEGEEDKILQQRFLELYKSSPDFDRYHGWIHPEFRIGTNFLRKNSGLLGQLQNPS